MLRIQTFHFLFFIARMFGCYNLFLFNISQMIATINILIYNFNYQRCFVLTTILIEYNGTIPKF